MNGSILLKINHLDGQAEVLCQIYMDEQRVWTPAHTPSLMKDRQADAFIFQEGEKDPDLWLIEVEDKEGNIWFPGKIIDL